MIWVWDVCKIYLYIHKSKYLDINLDWYDTRINHHLNVRIVIILCTVNTNIIYIYINYIYIHQLLTLAILKLLNLVCCCCCCPLEADHPPTSHLVLHGDQQFRRPRKAQRATEGSLTPNLRGAGAVERDMLKTGQSTSQQFQNCMKSTDLHPGKHEYSNMVVWERWLLLNMANVGIYVKFLGVDFLKAEVGRKLLDFPSWKFSHQHSSFCWVGFVDDVWRSVAEKNFNPMQCASLIC